MVPSPQPSTRRQSLGSEMVVTKSPARPAAPERDMKKELEQWQEARAEKKAREATKKANKDHVQKARRSYTGAHELSMEASIEAMENSISVSRSVRDPNAKVAFKKNQRPTTSFTSGQGANRPDAAKSGKSQNAPKQTSPLRVSSPAATLPLALSRSAQSMPDLHSDLVQDASQTPQLPCSDAAEGSEDLSAYLPALSPRPASLMRMHSPSPGQKKLMVSPRQLVSSACGQRGRDEMENSMLDRKEFRSPSRASPMQRKSISPLVQKKPVPAGNWRRDAEESAHSTPYRNESPRLSRSSPGRAPAPVSSPMQRKSISSPMQTNRRVVAAEKKKPTVKACENSAFIASNTSTELSAILHERRRKIDQQMSDAEKMRRSPGRPALVELDSNSANSDSPCEKRNAKSRAQAFLSTRGNVLESQANCSQLTQAEFEMYEESHEDAHALPRAPVNSPDDVRSESNRRYQVQLQNLRTKTSIEAVVELLGASIRSREPQVENPGMPEEDQPEETQRQMESEADVPLENSHIAPACETPSDKQSDKSQSWSSGRVSLLSLDMDESASPAPAPETQSPRRKLDQFFDEHEQSALEKMCQQLQHHSAKHEEKRPLKDVSVNTQRDEAIKETSQASASSACSPSISRMKEKLSRHQILWTDKPVVNNEDHLSRAWSIEEFWFFEMRDRIPDDKRPIPKELDEIPEHPPEWPDWKSQSYDSREAMRRDKVLRRSLSTFR